MEFWPGNQGQSPLYSTFTVPGRNCTQIYHDRPQPPRGPLYYGERQEHRREPGYWTLPGSRAASQDYGPWTEQDPVGPPAPHFPFILERHPQHHQDLGAYQPYEPRDREWAQRGPREYERGFPREGWPRRWETCNPARYGREASAKRSDSSYRELEAWAARYSHSLQRRRRIEAELRGAAQGLERDTRGGTAALQPAPHPGLCDRAARMQVHPPPQAAPADPGHPARERSCFQRRPFSQPPGYIAPPPYDTPPKREEGRKHAPWSHPVLRNQDVAADPGTGPAEGSACSRHSRPEPDPLQGGGAGHAHRPHVQFEGAPVLQSQAEEPSSKIIEGRKFRLNKRAGGMTVFCLVSRIADVPASPGRALQTDPGSTEGGGAQTQKLADEVDYRAPAPPEESGPSGTGEADRPEESCTDTEQPETDAPEEKGKEAADAGKPALKYPLWREPTFPVRTECPSSPTRPEAKGESEVLRSKDSRTEDEEEPEEDGGLLTADTTCVVVKMEQIPSPKKEHVHYVEASPHPDHSPGDPDQSTETQLPQAQTEPDLLGQVEPEPRNVSDRETLEERAERILGIPLNESVAEQRPGAAAWVCGGEASEDRTQEEEEEAQNQLEDQTEPPPGTDQLDVQGGQESAEPQEEISTTPSRASGGGDAGEIGADRPENAEELSEKETPLAEDDAAPPSPSTGSWPSSPPDRPGPDVLPSPVPSSSIPTSVSENPDSNCNDLEPFSAPDMTSSAQTPWEQLEFPPPHDPQSATTWESEGQTPPGSDVLDPGEGGQTSQMTDGETSEELEDISKDQTEELGLKEQEEVREMVEAKESGGADPDQDQRAEEEEVQVDSGVEETETPKGVGQSQGEDVTCMEESPRTEEELSEDPEEELSKDPEEELSKDPEEELSEDPEEEPSKDPGEEPSKDPDEELSKDPEEELSEDPEEEPSKDPEEEPSKDPEEELSKDPEEEPSKDPEEEPSKDPEEELSKDPEEEPSKDPDEELSKDPEEELSKDPEEELSKDPEEEPSKDPDEEPSKDPEEELSKDPEEEPSKDPDEELSKDPEVEPSKDPEEEISEDPEEELTEQKQTAEKPKEDIAQAAISQPAGTFTVDTEPPEEVHAGLSETASDENSSQLSHSEEMMTGDASNPKETSHEPSEGAPEEPTTLQAPETGKEAHRDTENQQELEPANPPPPSPPDLGVNPPSELPEPSRASHSSDQEVTSSVVMDPSFDATDAVTIETDIPPLHLAPSEESQKSSPSSGSLLVHPGGSSPLLPPEGGESDPSDSPLGEEPQYPQSLWDAVNRIRKHTAPDSENEEEEASEMWDPENVGEDSGGAPGTQDTTAEKKEDDEGVEGSAEQMQQDPGEAEEDRPSRSSDGRNSSGEKVHDEEEDPASENGPEIRTVKVEELQTAPGEGSCTDGDQDGDEAQL